MAGEDQRRGPCITLYTKSDCELCREAKATLLALRRELAFELEEVDITTDASLDAAFREAIPVGYLDGRKIFKYHVDPTLLRRQFERRRQGLGVGWFFARRP
jgi:glutaredoxin